MGKNMHAMSLREQNLATINPVKKTGWTTIQTPTPNYPTVDSTWNESTTLPQLSSTWSAPTSTIHPSSISTKITDNSGSTWKTSTTISLLQPNWQKHIPSTTSNPSGQKKKPQPKENLGKLQKFLSGNIQDRGLKWTTTWKPSKTTSKWVPSLETTSTTQASNPIWEKTSPSSTLSTSWYDKFRQPGDKNVKPKWTLSGQWNTIANGQWARKKQQKDSKLSPSSVPPQSSTSWTTTWKPVSNAPGPPAPPPMITPHTTPRSQQSPARSFLISGLKENTEPTAVDFAYDFVGTSSKPAGAQHSSWKSKHTYASPTHPPLEKHQVELNEETEINKITNPLTRLKELKRE